MRSFLTILAVVLLTSCATTAPTSRTWKDTSPLQLGKTTESEARSLYGEPKDRHDRTSAEGPYSIVQFSVIGDRKTKACARMLELEFKNDVLSGFQFGSSFPEDRTTFAIDKVSKIEWATSTRDEVLQILGEPHGKAKPPTNLTTLGKISASAKEVWIYNSWDGVDILATRRPKKFPIGTVTTIGFDHLGMVVDIQTTRLQRD